MEEGTAGAGGADVAAGPARPGVPWRTLSRKKKVLRVLAATFATLHLGCAWATMGPPGKLRDLFFVVAHYYTSQLRMTTSWDMFGGPPDSALVVVEGRVRGGHRVSLANPFRRGWNVWARVVDARLRKMHQKLKKKGHRNRWGDAYLEYVCRTEMRWHPGLRDARVVRIDPETKNDDDEVTAPLKRRTLMRHRCGQPTPAEPARPARPAQGRDAAEEHE